jgi:hypothetical protein
MDSIPGLTCLYTKVIIRASGPTSTPAIRSSIVARGTRQTGIRLTDDDKAKIQAIQERHNLPSVAATIRYSLEMAYRMSRRNSEKKAGATT